jgi:hypothetical protein
MRRALRQKAAALGLGMMMAVAAGAAEARQTSKPQDVVTIVGCLVQAPSSRTDEFFLRTPAIAVPAGTQVAVGGSGSAAGAGRATTSAGSPDTVTLYRVTGLTASDLKPHLNHRIEVQGRLTSNAPPATSATTKSDPKSGRTTTTVKEDWTIAGVVQATTMKMVAASCQ